MKTEVKIRNILETRERERIQLEERRAIVAWLQDPSNRQRIHSLGMVEVPPWTNFKVFSEAAFFDNLCKAILARGNA